MLVTITNKEFMKRILFIAGLALTMLSCAQHDTQSPDTSGVDPQKPNDGPAQTAPTDSSMQNMQNNPGGTNSGNGGSTNNRQNQ